LSAFGETPPFGGCLFAAIEEVEIASASRPRNDEPSFYDVDVLLFAHIFEDFWPDGCADLADMGLFQQEHKGSGLAYAAADTKWNLVVNNGLMVWELQKIELAGHLQLLFKGLGVDANAH